MPGAFGCARMAEHSAVAATGRRYPGRRPWQTLRSCSCSRVSLSWLRPARSSSSPPTPTRAEETMSSKAAARRPVSRFGPPRRERVRLRQRRADDHDHDLAVRLCGRHAGLDRPGRGDLAASPFGAATPGHRPARVRSPGRRPAARPGRRPAGARALGGEDWCYETPGVAHDDHACERFAATFAWTFWPSADNNQRSEAVMSPKAFRSLMSRLLPAPRSSPALRRGALRSGPSGRASARLTRTR